MWGYFVGPLVVAAAALPLARITGSWPEFSGRCKPLSGSCWAGRSGGPSTGGWQPRRSRTAPQAATIIPLDMVASLQTFRPTRLGSLFRGETLVVTTADGTEYGFRGRTGNLQNDIASALAGLGREVRATTTGLAVNSRALNGEG